MSTQSASDTSQSREVAESSFEFLLGELVALDYPTKGNDPAVAIIQRLDTIGYDVGYR